MDWNIGCSGFHYKHWKGTFYPEKLAQTKWFDFYCQHFNTLELNVTFYRFPRLPAMQNWRASSPDNFRFAVKAPKAITHFKKFNDVTRYLVDFYNTTREGLQDKLGCVIFQMPPNFHYSEEHLERLIKNVDNSFLNVLEFRHESWWKTEVYQELGKHNITFCGMSHPSLPKEVVNNTPLLYYRMHGEDQLYASNYKNEDLFSLKSNIENCKLAEHAYVFFNNDINTYAAYNAQTLKEIIE